MWKPSRLILADASILILLDNANLWHILQELFEEVSVTSEVAAEFGSELPAWIQYHEYKDNTLFAKINELVGKGEASLLTCALEHEDSEHILLLLDDLKARKLAMQFGLNFTGLLGILLFAKEKTVIDEVKPHIDLLLEAGMRLSPKLLANVLKQAGE